MDIYGEYIKHQTIPNGRAQILFNGKKYTLYASPEWKKEFKNRAQCVKWLCKTMPDALFYRFYNGVTLCGGTVASLEKCL